MEKKQKQRLRGELGFVLFPPEGRTAVESIEQRWAGRGRASTRLEERRDSYSGRAGKPGAPQLSS